MEPNPELNNDVINRLTELERTVAKLKNTPAPMVTTQIVQAPNHSNTITSSEFTPIPGAIGVFIITRPSKAIVFTHFHSIVNPNGQGEMSVDVTAAINGKIMTLGGSNNISWPAGSSVSHCRDWTNGVSITEEVVQPGSYHLDIRARLRGPPGTPASVNGPAALLIIVPL